MPTFDASLLAALLMFLLFLAVIGGFLVVVIRLALRPFRRRDSGE
ncbi:MAG TPA: hypothetical protein PKA95_12950 [Thermomicrobiales bacterium]|nr:hypothetical protein [Thermomicrobiales bacterium]